jgi:glucosylceramidase
MTTFTKLKFSLALAVSLGILQPVEAVNVWVTTGDKSQLLRQQTDVLFQSGVGSGGTPISVVPTTTFQTISGFGAALTDSSAWLIKNELTAAQRDKLMRQLFSPKTGIGLNYVRVPLGASDFTASGYYSYNSNPAGGTDEFQQQFSIAHDEAYIIPQLQQAKALNPDLKLMGSPWSAPGWMKTNGSMTGVGGALKTQWEASYALYLTKAVQAYAAAELPFDTLTLQNEPLHTSNYPTMSMSATQQANIIKNHLGPQFVNQGIGTKIVAYDHNWDNTSYPLAVLNDHAARPYVAGTAFHAYAGSVSAQTTVHNAYPDKDIYFTEITGGDYAPNFSDNLVWYFQNILNGSVRNWSKTALFWNLALDQNNGPHLNGCGDCRGVVTINTATGGVTFNEEFYALGQVTKAVQPNAVRISSTTYPGGIDTVAYKNPDGSQALVALNPSSAATTIRVVNNGKNFSFLIPGKSVATFQWDDHGADFDNGGFDDGGFQQGGGSLDAWTRFGDTTGNVSVQAEAVLAGDKSLKLFGQFAGVPNVSGVSQGITVVPGQELTASLNALVRSADTIAGTSNSAELILEYYSQHGAAAGSSSFLGDERLLVADATTAPDVWNLRQLTSTVPAGAVEARLVVQFLQPSNQAGAVHIDSVLFGVANAIMLPGDYDSNQVVDELDYNLWLRDFGSTMQLLADGNRDGVVNGADYTVWRDFVGSALVSSSSFPLSIPEPHGLPTAIGGLLSIVGLTSRALPADHSIAQSPPAR